MIMMMMILIIIIIIIIVKPEGKIPLGDTGVDGRIILRCIFRKWDVGVWTGSSWLRIGKSGGRL
jgi:hypothetical protein